MIIAQISDIHAAPDNNNLLRFEDALTWLDLLQPDCLVITGDLIDDDWFKGHELISARLNERSYPSFILPGNSDNNEKMRACFGDSFWADARSEGKLHFAADIGEIRLIGLDTTVAGTAAGSMDGNFVWLEKALSAQGPATSVLFLHHHVFQSGIPSMDNIMCRETPALAEFLRNTPRPPVAIATGHVHRPVAGQLAGIPAYICGSICPANPVWFGSETIPPANDPPSLMIHRFAEGALVSHHVSI